jgi:hypothetical protein
MRIRRERNISFRLDDEEYKLMEAYVSDRGQSLASAARGFVLQGIRRTKAIETAADPVVALTAQGSAKIRRARSKLEETV